MQLSDHGIRFLKQQESLRLIAYKDSAGVWTIGYGSTQINGVPVRANQVIAEVVAERCLRVDCWHFERAVNNHVTAVITQNQFDALVSFTYNVGIGSFSISTLRKHINTAQPVVLDLFTRWNKVHSPTTKQLVVVPGLTRRREREFALYSQLPASALPH